MTGYTGRKQTSIHFLSINYILIKSSFLSSAAYNTHFQWMSTEVNTELIFSTNSLMNNHLTMPLTLDRSMGRAMMKCSVSLFLSSI